MTKGRTSSALRVSPRCDDNRRASHGAAALWALGRGRRRAERQGDEPAQRLDGNGAPQPRKRPWVSVSRNSSAIFKRCPTTNCCRSDTRTTPPTSRDARLSRIGHAFVTPAQALLHVEPSTEAMAQARHSSPAPRASPAAGKDSRVQTLIPKMALNTADRRLLTQERRY